MAFFVAEQELNDHHKEACRDEYILTAVCGLALRWPFGMARHMATARRVGRVRGPSEASRSRRVYFS